MNTGRADSSKTEIKIIRGYKWLHSEDGGLQSQDGIYFKQFLNGDELP
jgi:hypothetical protein